MTEWLSVTEYATTYAVTRPTVYKWLDAGLLEVWQVGRVIRIKNRPPSCKTTSTTSHSLSR